MLHAKFQELRSDWGIDFASHKVECDRQRARGRGGHVPVRVILAILSVGLSVLISGTVCYGQLVNASLYGSVTDPTGLAVPNASVTAVETSTGIATKTTSDTAGNYVLPSLAPGNYTITVELSHFKSTVISGITLLVDQKARVDARLEVGAVNTLVEVKGAAPLVETSTASIGTVVGTQQAVELPLNLRRIGALATLVPGTTPDNGGFASSEFGSPFSETTFSANGTKTSSNAFVIDGVESQSMTFGGVGLQPPPDAVAEFKIQTNIYNAAFGRFAGSTVNLVTKSGANEIHGTAYEFLRNNDLDARNFFATNQTNPVTGAEIPGSARPEFRRNQFGVAVGGPLRKNKTFWFANYEGLRQIEGESLGNLIPTDLEKSGDFSSFFTGQTVNLCGNGGPANLNFDSGQLFNPATESLYTCPAGSANAGSNIMVGTPVPGNMITTIDPVAQKALAYYPEPNRPGYPNYVNQDPLSRFDHQIDGRIDENISSKDQLFARYLFGESHITDPSSGFTTLPGFGDIIYYRGQNIVLSWTHTFGPHLLNEARFGFQRNWDFVNCESCPRGPNFTESFGISGLHALSPIQEDMPWFGLVNFSGIGDSNYRPVISPDMVEKYQDNLTWTHGGHTVVVGTDLPWFQQLDDQAAYAQAGRFGYDGRYSSLAGELPGASGFSDLADFLMGYPATAARSARYLGNNRVGGTFSSLYGNDDFKVSPNFVINFGLRYEFRRPTVDKRDNVVDFVPLGPKFSGPGDAILLTAANDALNDSFCTDPFYSYLDTSDGRCLVATAAERAKLGFTGRTRRTLMFNDFTDFAPRLGLTWRPTHSDKLILRTGFGIFYDTGDQNALDSVALNPVYSPSQIFTPTFGTPPQVLGNGSLATTENAFGGGGIPPVVTQNLALYSSPYFHNPRIQMWSLGVESQLSHDVGLEIDYVGNHGVHQEDEHFFGNQPLPGLGDYAPRRPYPDLGLICYVTWDANSNYNSLQAKLTKRFSHGVTFLASYTWGHSIDEEEGNEGFSGGIGNTSAQNDNNRDADRARSYTDIGQRFVYSYIWQLPVGSGRRFLNQSGWMDRVLGGWEFSGITTLQSGFPMSVLSPLDFSNSQSNNPRPDRICNGTGHKTVSDWFDASCFTVTGLEAALTAGQPRFGNSGRNILDGPGLDNWDIAMLKTFSLSERFKLQFRGESYNLCNQAHFGKPNTTITTATVGQIGSAGEPREIQFGLKLSF
jgi:hypothetical protein